MQRFPARPLAGGLLLLISLLFTTVQAQTLVIAQLSDRPKKDFKQLRPMAEAVAERLESLGVDGVDVRLYRELPELVRAVRTGEVHWITETPYSAAVLVHEAGAVPLLQKWKSGQRRYQTLVYTRRDSGVKTLEQLLGKRIAFEHSQSFTSYYLPRQLLVDLGLPLHRLESLNQENLPHAVNYLFSRNEKNNALWVHKGLVQAGALNTSDWDNPARVPEAIKGELRIIHRSKLYPRALELVSPSLPAELAEALKKVLLSMTPATDGALLARYERTAGFEPVGEDLRPLLAEIYQSSRRWEHR